MRFTTLFASAAALATFTNGAVVPRATASKGDIQTIGKGICDLETALGVPDIEDFLNTALGGALVELDDKLGVTSVEQAIGSLDCMPGPKPTTNSSDIQLIGKGLCEVEKGLGVTDLLATLNTTLAGALSSLEDALGVTYLEDVLQLNSC